LYSLAFHIYLHTITDSEHKSRSVHLSLSHDLFKYFLSFLQPRLVTAKSQFQTMHSKLTFTIYPQATSISSALETPLSSPWSQIVTSEPESDWIAEAAEYYQRKFDKSMQEPSSPAPPKHSGIPKRDPPQKCSKSSASTIRATPVPVWPDFEPERDWEQVAAEYYQRKYQMGLMVSPKRKAPKKSAKKLITSFCKSFPGRRVPIMVPKFGLPEFRARSRKADPESDEIPFLGPESESGDDPFDVTDEI
ncbi:hypothetical protein DFP73DRAFT_623177, partial [Morchella snyderi]